MTTVSEHGILPLAPIEQPKGIFTRLLYALTRRRYGMTPTAFRVIYARNPAIACVSAFITMVVGAGLSIPRELAFLVNIAYATRSGCTFCMDLQLAEAVRARIGRERFRDLLDFETSDRFTPAEKAALAYVAASHASLHVPDEVHARLRARFDDRQIVEIVWLCAVERYFNAMALPLRIGSDSLAA